MNKKKLLLLLPVIALTSCAKTENLYTLNQYNSPIFDENYYTEWEGIDKIEATQTNGLYSNLDFSVQKLDDKIKIGGQVVEGYTWGHTPEFGYNHNLSKIEKKFNYGVTSKLFDGRVRCEGLYQKSRVQLDKSGFAMYFPKALKQTKYLGFACRGGSDYKAGEEFRYSDMKINVEWSFYVHVDSSTYKKVTYKLNAVEVPVDNGGNTVFVNFTPYITETFEELYDATAMSFKWEFADPDKLHNEHFKKYVNKVDEEDVNADRLLPDGDPNIKYYVKDGEKIVRNTQPYNEHTEYYYRYVADGLGVHDDMTDDYTQKEKHHLSLMLYEVFIGDSIWG